MGFITSFDPTLSPWATALGPVGLGLFFAVRWFYKSIESGKLVYGQHHDAVCKQYERANQEKDEQLVFWRTFAMGMLEDACEVRDLATRSKVIVEKVVQDGN